MSEKETMSICTENVDVVKSQRPFTDVTLKPFLPFSAALVRCKCGETVIHHVDQKINRRQMPGHAPVPESLTPDLYEVEET